MKIAIISMIREPWGGSEELWSDMASYALKANHEVIHSTFDFHTIAPKEQKLIDAGLQHSSRRGFIRPGTPRIKRIFLKLINHIVNSLQNPFHAIISFKPDYILYNGTCYSIADEKYLIRVLKNRKIPFGILGHYNREDGKDITDQKIIVLQELYSLAKNNFFISRRALSVAEKRTGSGIPRAAVVRNPVNMASLETISYPENTYVHFAMVGNLRVIHKGQDIVLNILGKSEWKNRDWHLDIYGSGEDENMLRHLTMRLQINERVSFHGKVDNIRKVWEDNHILLMPSLMEGMPLAVVEAMLCGRPSVVTDVGGQTEWIEEDKEGWIASVPARFEEAMEKAWNLKDTWKQTGINAHHKAMRLYDPASGQTLFTFIKNAIANEPLSKDH